MFQTRNGEYVYTYFINIHNILFVDLEKHIFEDRQKTANPIPWNPDRQIEFKPWVALRFLSRFVFSRPAPFQKRKTFKYLLSILIHKHCLERLNLTNYLALNAQNFVY